MNSSNQWVSKVAENQKYCLLVGAEPPIVDLPINQNGTFLLFLVSLFWFKWHWFGTINGHKVWWKFYEQDLCRPKPKVGA